MNPGDIVQKLKERMEKELASVSKGETRKRELEKAINQKEGEKARTLDLYKWGLLTVEDLDKDIRQHRQDLEPLQAEMASLLNQGAEQGQKVGKLTDAESLLKALQDRIKGPVDWDTKRRVVESLVWGISVKTVGKGRKKKASVEIIYAFEPNSHVVVNAMAGSGGTAEIEGCKHGVPSAGIECSSHMLSTDAGRSRAPQFTEGYSKSPP